MLGARSSRFADQAVADGVSSAAGRSSAGPSRHMARHEPAAGAPSALASATRNLCRALDDSELVERRVAATGADREPWSAPPVAVPEPAYDAGGVSTTQM